MPVHDEVHVQVGRELVRELDVLAHRKDHRGGVLVAIKSEPRAADALAILHSYGGGNAAIGAWTGRV